MYRRGRTSAGSRHRRQRIQSVATCSGTVLNPSACSAHGHRWANVYSIRRSAAARGAPYAENFVGPREEDVEVDGRAVVVLERRRRSPEHPESAHVPRVSAPRPCRAPASSSGTPDRARARALRARASRTRRRTRRQAVEQQRDRLGGSADVVDRDDESYRAARNPAQQGVVLPVVAREVDPDDRARAPLRARCPTSLTRFRR